jgi:hypothetical protein
MSVYQTNAKGQRLYIGGSAAKPLVIPMAVGSTMPKVR